MLVENALLVFCLALGCSGDNTQHTAESLLRDSNEVRIKDHIIDLSLFLAGHKKSLLYGFSQLIEVLKNRVRKSAMVFCLSC